MSATPSQQRPAWAVVAGREITVKLRDRNFIISTLTTLAIMAASIGFSVFLQTRTDHDTVAVADDAAAAVVQTAATLPEDQLGSTGDLELGTERVADRAAVEQQVRSGDADAGLLRTDSGWTVVGKDEVDSDLARRLTVAARTTALQEGAERAGTTVEALTAGAHVEQQTLESGAGDKGVQTVVTIVFAFLFYLAAMLFGYAISNSVVEEKQSRIVEIIAAAIPIRQLLAGKIVGATALALGQLALFVGVGLVGLSFTDYSSLLPLVGGAAAWFLVLFVCGFVAMAALFAAAGALATRTEDVQQTASPLLIAVMAASFGSMVLEGTGRTVASYVPVVSTVAMPSRVAAGQAAWWEPVLAVLLTLAFAALATGVAERIYRRSLMQTQGRLGWRQALRLQD